MELETTLKEISTWKSAETIFKEKDIHLDLDSIRKLNIIFEKGVDQTDEFIDQIPYMFIIQNNIVRIRIRFGKWIALTKETLSRLASLE